MKVLVLYYSQTGQLKEVVTNALGPLLNDPEVEVDIVPVETDHQFPYPWTRMEFFNVFPESVNGTPFKLKPLVIERDKQYDLVILAYTVWYLNPSIPISSLLQHEDAKTIFKGRKVVTLIGSRNMWVLAQEKVKQHLHRLGGELIGNVVLTDRNKNLVSIITIIRWLFYGRKDAFWGFPKAGILEEDIRDSETFGRILLERLKTQDLTDMQEQLNAAGALRINPSLLILEYRASRLFKKYASFITRKGGFNDPDRRGRVSLLSMLLPIGAFVLSPITTLSTAIVNVLKRKELEEDIRYYEQNRLRK